MIKFKQKNYIAWATVLPGALNTGMLGLTGASMIQAHNQGKEQEQQAEAMQQQMKQQNRALEKIAKNAAKNPQAAQQVVSVMGQRNQSAYSEDGRLKLFGIAGNAIGFAKDIGKAAWNRRDVVTSGLAFAVPSALAAYGADRYIQKDLKKRGQPVVQPQPQQKSYANVPKASIWKTLSKYNAGSITAGAAFGGGIPLLSYYAGKKANNDQIKQSQPQSNLANTRTVLPTQKSYANIGGLWKGVKNGWKGVKEGWKSFKSHPGQSTLNKISNFAGGGGREGVNNLANEFKQSKNPWTKGVGNFISKHPKTALAGSAVIGLGTMTTVWDTGEKVTRKGLEKLDKNAFAYEKMQNQQVN